VETKNRWGFKCLEFYRGCEINDYSQFPSWIFLTLNFVSISYDSSSQGGYSSLM